MLLLFIHLPFPQLLLSVSMQRTIDTYKCCTSSICFGSNFLPFDSKYFQMNLQKNVFVIERNKRILQLKNRDRAQSQALQVLLLLPQALQRVKVNERLGTIKFVTTIGGKIFSKRPQMHLKRRIY